MGSCFFLRRLYGLIRIHIQNNKYAPLLCAIIHPARAAAPQRTVCMDNRTEQLSCLALGLALELNDLRADESPCGCYEGQACSCRG